MNEYTKVNWQDGTVLQPAKVTIDGVDYEVEPAVESGTTPVNATNLDKMDTALKQSHDGVRILEANKIDKSTIELLTVDSVAPEHCSEGDLYYNTTTNYIYTATGTDTWGDTGELPSNKYLYVDLTNSKLYYYDGINFTSYGGGSSNDVVISPTQPTGDDWKIWIDSGEVGSQASEITNSYSESTGLGYSCNYINGTVLFLSSTNLGDADNITLSDSIDNYKEIEIYYNRYGLLKSVRIPTTVRLTAQPDNLFVVCDMSIFSNTVLRVYTTTYIISGTSMTRYAYSYYNVGQTAPTQNSENNLTVTKVIGYK